jgi:hypothetical protein
MNSNRESPRSGAGPGFVVLTVLLNLFERLSANENVIWEKQTLSKITIHTMPDVGLTSSAGLLAAISLLPYL